MRMALEFSTCWLRRREQELVGYTVIGHGASLYQTTLAHTYVKPAASRPVMRRGKEEAVAVANNVRKEELGHIHAPIPWCGRTEHSYSNRSSRISNGRGTGRFLTLLWQRAGPRRRSAGDWRRPSGRNPLLPPNSRSKARPAGAA